MHSNWTKPRGPVTSLDGSAYHYDSADHLTTLPSGTTQAFDPAGQITSVTTSGTQLTYNYDTKGERTRGGTPGQAANTYSYNQAGQLASTTVGSSGAVYTYRYDADGLRASKTTGGTTERFTWDTVTGKNPLLLVDDGTNYLYGPDGQPLEQRSSSGTILWYHHDQAGSTRILTTSSGTVAGTATYDPYGKTTSTTGTVSKLGYDGEYTDTETGFIYLRARYYDPGTGQFLTVDPARSSTLEPYEYASDDPLDNEDPLGNYPSRRVRKVWNFFKSKGLSGIQVAGIVGNFMEESRGTMDPNTHQENNGPGRGIAQWEVGDRWDTLVAFANAHDASPTSLGLQLRFAWHELNTTYSAALQRLRKAKTITNATVWFEQSYEGSTPPNIHMAVRYSQAWVAWIKFDMLNGKYG